MGLYGFVLRKSRRIGLWLNNYDWLEFPHNFNLAKIRNNFETKDMDGSPVFI